MGYSENESSELFSEYEDVFSYNPNHKQINENDKIEDVKTSIYPQPIFNGRSIYEYDLDRDFETQPWRERDAILCDYFNYGLTEETWKRFAQFKRQEAANKKI